MRKVVVKSRRGYKEDQPDNILILRTLVYVMIKVTMRLYLAFARSQLKYSIKQELLFEDAM